jgi:hypothetical protein
MKRIIRLTEKDLSRIVKRVVNEDYRNSSELFDMEYRKIISGLHQVQQTAESGDGEQAAFITGNILMAMDRLKSFVDEMRETR